MDDLSTEQLDEAIKREEIVRAAIEANRRGPMPYDEMTDAEEAEHGPFTSLDDVGFNQRELDPAGHLAEMNEQGTCPVCGFDPVKEEKPVPTIQEFAPYIEQALSAIRDRCHVAGARYGEDVLFVLGEDGAVSQAYTKAARILWSWKQGHSRHSRKDSWLDLAGYAILEMARELYATGMDPRHNETEEAEQRFELPFTTPSALKRQN